MYSTNKITPESSLPQTLNVSLGLGRLTLFFTAGDYAPHDLFGFAQRRNPKRAFLFVSKVLGRHIPVSPAKIRATMDSLAARIPERLPGPIVVIGMAETAVALGAGVHQALSRTRHDTLYICTTRHPLNMPILAEFKEEHSHATQQVLHWPQHDEDLALLHRARSLVLVDDEASTGKTFANLVAALQKAGLTQFESIVAVTLTDWSGGEVTQRLGEKAISVSLLSGRWEWQANNVPPPEMPHVDMLGMGEWQAKAQHDWGRLAVRQHPLPAIAERLCCISGERLLVLGTGEFVWPPFLLAEHLEKQGALVRFSATTRSPIALGHSIEHRHCLQDNYGQGIPNFLYNIVPQDYDRILLCTETTTNLLDAALITALQAASLEFYP